MPELWEVCDNASKAVLIQLYWQEHGCFPDFYYKLTGECEPEPGTIDAPDYEEEYEIELEKEMSEAPKSERYHELA